MTPEQVAAVGTLLSWLKDAGVLGAALLFIRMLLRGEIVTKDALDRLVTEKDTQIAKGEARENEWKRIALGLTEVNRELAPEVKSVLRSRMPEQR